MSLQQIIGGLAGTVLPLVIIGYMLLVTRPWNIRKKILNYRPKD